MGLLGDPAACSLGIKDVATDADWSTEYLDLTLSVRVVDDLEMALEHIRRYGSRHPSDRDPQSRHGGTVPARRRQRRCLPQLLDPICRWIPLRIRRGGGHQHATLPPRGPVGQGLVTYRYRLRGDGHIAADYASGDRQFTHRDLPA